MGNLWIFLIYTPVEHDGGTSIKFIFEFLCFFCIRQKLFVYIGKVRITNDNISEEWVSIFQYYAEYFIFGGQNSFHGGIVDKFHTEFFGNFCERLNPCIYASDGIPEIGRAHV